MQTDPIGYAGGLNLYAYVRGDPINRRDPFGLIEGPGEEIVVTAQRLVRAIFSVSLGSFGQPSPLGGLAFPSTVGLSVPVHLFRESRTKKGTPVKLGRQPDAADQLPFKPSETTVEYFNITYWKSGTALSTGVYTSNNPIGISKSDVMNVMSIYGIQ